MAWSDSGQVTQSILGIKGMQQQKKNDRWSKLMDIANVLQNTAGLGADLWKTVSGRKYQTSEREAGQTFITSEREASQQFERDMADTNLKNNKDWLDYQNEHPGKPADQLYAEWLMTEEGKRWQADQEQLRREGAAYDTSLRLKEILAGRGTGISESGWTAYNNAIEQARNNFYRLDETGNVVLKDGVTAEQVKNFLYGFANPAFASESDIPGLKMAFDMWVQNPDFPGAGSSTEQTSAVTSKEVADLLAAIKALADARISAGGSQPNLPVPPKAAGAAVGESGVAGGQAFLDAANRERTLEDDISTLLGTSGLTPVEKGALESALKDSKKIGYLDEATYQSYVDLVKTLKAKYEALGKRLLGN